jgi:hypothetical protein
LPSEARWTGAHGGQAFFAYSTNYLIDVDNAIIVDVEATTAIRQAEVMAAKRMIERSIDRFDLYPARLLGDSAYGSPAHALLYTRQGRCTLPRRDSWARSFVVERVRQASRLNKCLWRTNMPPCLTIPPDTPK